MPPGSRHESTHGLPSLILVTAVPVLTTCLLGPFIVFAENHAEFEAGFLDLLPTLLVLIGLLWAILVLVGLALRPAARERYSWLVLALGAAAWIQSTFLVHDYGLLDGRGLDWQAGGGLAWLDILLLIAIPLALLLPIRQLSGVLNPAAAAILVIQGVAAFDAADSLEPANWRAPAPEGPPSALFEFSTERNIVHIVLDNFQSDIFSELVAEDGLESNFDGFVQFTDNAAAAPYTNLAVPSILLGRAFDGSIPDSDFHKEAAERGLPSRLHDAGYRVNLSLMQSLEGTRHSAAYRVPSSNLRSTSASARVELLELMDIMLFRMAPHLARPWVYNDNNWRVRQIVDDPDALPKAFIHRQYLRRYAEQIEAKDDQPAYHFIHVWPPHPPYVTRVDGTPSRKALPNTRENYRNEARATLHAVNHIMQALKRRGLYDNSLIIVQSDHGGAFEPEFTPKRMMALLAVKRRNSHGPLVRSKAPTSVTDVAATIADEENLDMQWPGDSIFQVSENERRTRHYAMYHGQAREALQVIQIRGPLNSADSFHRLDPSELSVNRPLYQFGEVANVGLEGGATGYLASGWSAPFPNSVWNNGHEATLEIPIKSSDRPLELSLWVMPSIHGEDWPRQRVRLYIEDREIGSWELTERRSTKLDAVIPAGLAATDQLVLRFELPDAVRQKDLGVGQDRRLQAISLGRFRLIERTP